VKPHSLYPNHGRPSSEADSHSDVQEIHRLLWNPKVYYRVHKSPPVGPILSHNPITLRSILTLLFHQRIHPPSGLFLSGFMTTILYEFLIFIMRATYSSHLTFFELITLVNMQKRRSYDASRYAVFSCHFLPRRFK
jgi:hypothetical protein